MSFENQLEQLGFILPNPAKPAGSYKPCLIVDNIAYISGQGPLLEDGSFAKGVIGKDIDFETGQKHAQKCGLAILSALKNEIGDLNKVDQLIKITGFVNCTSDFTQQPLVINGCSDLMKEIFGDKGVHARAAVGVNSLPLGFSVEIEAIFKIRL
ncbi:RidA family protein [Alphaproteobacteria bacterium]|nr:RidA family protein [Alphaproteobacteria bacterium]